MFLKSHWYSSRSLWLATGTVFLLVGCMLWYSNDKNETRIHSTWINSFAPNSAIPIPEYSFQLPWWVLTLDEKTRVTLTTQVPESPPDGQWFIDVIVREVGAKSPGQVVVNGVTAKVHSKSHAFWQRIYFPNRPAPGRHALEFSYKPHDPGSALEMWGTVVQPSTMESDGGELDIRRNGEAVSPREFKWVPFRGKRGVYEHAEVGKIEQEIWERFPDVKGIDFFWWFGVKKGPPLKRYLGLGLIFSGLMILAVLILKAFFSFMRREPQVCAALIGATVMTFALRYNVLLDVVESFKITVFGQTIINGLWWDDTGYFVQAFNILNESTPNSYTPTGFQVMASLIIGNWGLNPMPVKILMVVLQTSIGSILYYTAYSISQKKWLSFIPLVAWAFMLGPIQYEYQFLTETLAMFLFALSLAVFLSLRQEEDLGQQAASLIILMTIFAAAIYTRDVIIVFLPLAALGILISYGNDIRQKVLLFFLSLGILALFWLPVPLTHNNMGNAPTLMQWLPIAQERMALIGKQANLYGEGTTAPALMLGAVSSYFEGFIQAPLKAMEMFWNDAIVFWRNPQTVAGNIIRGSAFIPANNIIYNGFWVMGLIGAPVAFICQPKSRFLIILIIYITALHIVFIPHGLKRPKVIYFPQIILFGFFSFYEIYKYLHRYALALMSRPKFPWTRS